MFGVFGGRGGVEQQGPAIQIILWEGLSVGMFLLVRQCGEFLIWVVVPCSLHKVGMKVSNGQTRIRARQLGPAKTRDPPSICRLGQPRAQMGAQVVGMLS